MRQHILVCSLIVLLFMSSCNSQTSPFESYLSSVDTLVLSNPDSALALLQSIDTLLLTTNDIRAHYLLLDYMAHDKSYQTKTDTTSILWCTDYYDHHGDSYQRALAHFYAASTYRELNLQPQMFSHLLKAEYFAEKKTDKGLQALVYYNIGRIYYLNDLMEKAVIYYDKMNSVAIQIKDSVLLLHSYSLLGESLGFINQNDKAIKMLKKAEIIAEQVNEKRGLSEIQYRLSRLFYQKGDSSKSLYYAKHSCMNNMVQDHYLKLFMLGQAYMLNEQNDSAKKYLEQAISTDDIELNTNCYQLLSDICFSEGDSVQANSYLKHQVFYLDSLHLNKTDIEISELENQFSGWRQLQLYSSRMLTLLMCLFACIVISICLFIRWKKQHKTQQEQIEIINKALEVSNNKLENVTKENRTIVKENRKILSSIGDYDNLRKQKEELEVIIQEKTTEIAESQKKRQALNEDIIFKSDIYGMINNMIYEIQQYGEPQKRFKVDQINSLKAVIDSQYHDLSLRLKEEFGFSDSDILICCLAILNVKKEYLEHFLNVSRRTSYRRCDLICDRLCIPHNLAFLKNFLEKF